MLERIPTASIRRDSMDTRPPCTRPVSGGHDATVRLLLARGARIDIADTVYGGTPLGWAERGGQDAIARYLRQTQRQPR
jgi:ankyrin repeat protein